MKEQDSSMTPAPAAGQGPWKAVGIIFIISFILAGILAVWFGMQLASAQSQVSDLQDQAQDLQVQVEEMEAEKGESAAIAPFLYNRADPDFEYIELRMVDRRTGIGTTLARYESPQFVLYAVPQVGYDGRIFLQQASPDAGTGPLIPLEVTIDNPDNPKPVKFAGELPSATDATALSPDQVRLVAAYDNPAFGEDSKEVVIWNLLTGEREVIGSVEEDEYLSEARNTYGGVIGHNLDWLDRHCVRVNVYEDPDELPEGNESFEAKFKETRIFCSESVTGFQP